MKAPSALSRVFEENGFVYDSLYKKPVPNLPVFLGAYYEKVPGEGKVMMRLHLFYPLSDKEDFYFSISPGYLCYLGRDGFLRNNGDSDWDIILFDDHKSMLEVVKNALPKRCEEFLDPDLMIPVLDYFMGGPDVPPGFEYLKGCELTRGKGKGFAKEKVAYLNMAGRFDEAISILENDPIFFHPNAKGDYYQKLLSDAKNREIALNFSLPTKKKR